MGNVNTHMERINKTNFKPMVLHKTVWYKEKNIYLRSLKFSNLFDANTYVKLKKLIDGVYMSKTDIFIIKHHNIILKIDATKNIELHNIIHAIMDILQTTQISNNDVLLMFKFYLLGK